MKIKSIRPSYKPIASCIRIVNHKKWLETWTLKALADERKRQLQRMKAEG